MKIMLKMVQLVSSIFKTVVDLVTRKLYIVKKVSSFPRLFIWNLLK